MNIGIFSKFECAGGSEFRCAEMANGISQVNGCRATLLAERKIAEQVRRVILPRVHVVEGVFSAPHVDALYAVDSLLVVNTDSKEFTRIDYWEGRTPRHNHTVDLKRMRSMTFLFNFLVSPARHLSSLREYVPDLRIITANRKFFAEISEQERYLAVQHYPRLCLESPISSDGVSTRKTPSAHLRFGAHARAVDSKWNADFPKLIDELNSRHANTIAWDFMGMPRALAEQLATREHVQVRPEFAIPVKEFLTNIDVFVSFASWKREEPWARSVAEGLSSGCPVLATAKGGNRDQIVHGNNGFLCDTMEQFVKGSERFIREPELRAAMRRNALAYARRFSSTEVTQRFLDFLTW
jgi:hypothetical protein